MKTSVTQFELMTTFMEQHGDISKPIANAKGRLSNMKLWEELCNLLNSDGGGDTKTIEKWKKVWSDYKNNTKKKAARIHKAATDTCGGPAICAKLNDLEQRVLHIMGVQVAIGLANEEAGLVQETRIKRRSQTLEQPIQCLQPGPSGEPNVSSHSRFENGLHKMETRSLSGQTTPMTTRLARTQRAPRRRVRPAYIEQAALQFLQSNDYWKKINRDQHKDYMDLRREKIRIRELELQTQREWQHLALRGLEILDKIATKICSE